MKVYLLLYVLLVFVASNAFSQNGQTPVLRNGKLSVKNNLIVNQYGVQPQLRGVSLSWSLWQGEKYYNKHAVNWLVKDFKISILRAAMGVQPNHGYLQEPERQSKMEEEVVDQAIKDGIYVLIDWHDHHSNQHLTESKAFFAKMAQRYAKYPNVIYEIWNEPEKISWDTVKNYAVQIITEIRKYDSQNLIIVGSPHWDQDVDVAAADSIKGFNNIAYSFHFYASDPGHQEKLRERADKALAGGLPIMVTEWGVGESDGNGQFIPAKVDAWTQWLEKNKLSWANWNITDKDETTALLMPGASPYGHWKTSELTPAGNYIRNLLLSLNK